MTSAEHSGQRVHQRALTGLRGLAVVLVFLSHSAQRDMLLTPWINFEGMGLIGVYAFFCLSAYLLTCKLLANSYVSYGHYLMSRFFRIAPLYFLVLIGVYAAQAMTGSLHSHYLFIEQGNKGLLLHLLFLRGDGIFWTLPVEFSFYLLLPLIVSLRQARYFVPVLSCTALAYFLIYYLIQVAHSLPETYALKAVDISHSGQFLDVFLCGVIAAFLTERRMELPKRNTLYFLVPMLIFGMSAFTLVCVARQIAGFHQEWFDLRYYSIIFGILFAAAIHWARHPWIQRIFTGKVLIFLGEISFSVYLLHFLIFQQINQYDLAPAIKFLLATVACILIAWIARRYIEAPGIALGNHLVKTRFRHFFEAPKILSKVFLDHSRLPDRA